MHSQAFGGFNQMSMEQFPMEQSFRMSLSDMDWKHNAEDVIAGDNNSPFNQAPENNQAFETTTRDPSQRTHPYEQSWGLYFAQKSPAMGTIDGTSRLRPEFSHSSEDTKNRVISLGLPQTPPENNERPSIIPELSLTDLLSPNEKRIECEIDHVNNAKLSLTNSENAPRFEECIARLQEAIQLAIKRRRTLDPEVVINKNKEIRSNESNIKSCEIVTTEMKDIQQKHRFIQFYVDPTQMLFNETKYIKQECNDLCEYYVSKLKEINSDCVLQHTLWLNMNTKQCTFHVLMSNNGDIEVIEWTQLFEGMLQRYKWIDPTRKQMMFSQLIPQKAVS